MSISYTAYELWSGDEGAVALFEAAENGSAALCTFLMNRPADPVEDPRVRSLALHIAVENAAENGEDGYKTVAALLATDDMTDMTYVLKATHELAERDDRLVDLFSAHYEAMQTQEQINDMADTVIAVKPSSPRLH